MRAAADGAGVVPAVAGLISGHVRRGELSTVALEDGHSRRCWYATTLKPEHRTTATPQLLNFLTTPDAMQIMCSTGTGGRPRASGRRST